MGMWYILGAQRRSLTGPSIYHVAPEICGRFEHVLVGMEYLQPRHISCMPETLDTES